MVESGEMINLKSSDGQIIKMDKSWTSKSKLLTDMLADYTGESDFPLPDVNGETLNKVVEFLKEYHDKEPKAIEKPLKTGNLSVILAPWDFNFVDKLTDEECINLLNAANYMDIPHLLNLCSAKIASIMINLPANEVVKRFGIECDMTEAEKKEYDKYPID